MANWVIRHEWVLHLRLRVDFHGRIIFTRVNKIEAMFERPRVNGRHFFVYTRPSLRHCLYSTNTRKLYVYTRT